MFIAVVVTSLGAFVLLCWLMWDEISRVVRWQRKQHDRISKLEVHEKDQDHLLMAHDSRLDRQHAQLRMVKSDLKELGKDVGWADDNTKTQLAQTHIMFPQAEPEDEPPDDAA